MHASPPTRTTATKKADAADISLKVNECYSTTMAMELNECYATMETQIESVQNDIPLKANECYATNNAMTMELNESYVATASDIPLEANECYRTAATDGTTTIPVRFNECYGAVPALDAAQLDNVPETDKYDYVVPNLS